MIREEHSRHSSVETQESEQQRRPADNVPHPGAPDSEVLLEVNEVTGLHLPDKVGSERWPQAPQIIASSSSTKQKVTEPVRRWLDLVQVSSPRVSAEPSAPHICSYSSPGYRYNLELFTPSKLVLLSQAPRLCSLTFLGFVVYLPMSSSMTKQLSRVTWHHHKVDSLIHGALAPACHFGTLNTSASGFILRNLRSFRGQPCLDVSLLCCGST
ncbi:hypothetical protein CRENBAI_005593 [Crenichthys baileyi]|uniref:Uncharacterized protein n=1 Tax=Crenichthys baileyi TaxID=28760 RepID=A0AAV9S849_9TELE